jgi:hypothetical protein
LTSRELEVLQLINEGKANKQTASERGSGSRRWKNSRTSDAEAGHPRHRRLTRYAISAGIIKRSVEVTIIYGHGRNLNEGNQLG